MTPFGYRVLGFGAVGKGQTYTAVSQDIPAGTETEFAAHYSNSPNSDWISADKFIVIWSADNASPTYHGRSIVGSVSGTSISFGSMVHYSSNRAYAMGVCSDPFNDDKFVVAFENNSSSPVGHGHAVVGTVSGTTPSYGTEVAFVTSAIKNCNIDLDPNTENKFVIAYRDKGNSYYGTAVVGTISGTSVSFGTPVVFESANAYHPDVAYDINTAGKVVIAYSDSGNSTYGTGVVGTVSGTSISFGTPVVFASSAADYTEIASDPFQAGVFVVSYRDSGNSNYGTAVVGTVSGTSISFETPVVFTGTTAVVHAAIDFDPNTESKFIINTKGGLTSGAIGTVTVGTISGTTISFATPIELTSTNNNEQCVKFNPSAANAGKFVVTYGEAESGYHGKARLGQIASQTPDP